MRICRRCSVPFCSNWLIFGLQLATRPGPILLVDDLIDSGWTMAVVARMLRRSGAAAVLPLVLALTG